MREHPEFVNSHFLLPSHPPDVLGVNHSYSLPLITGALVRRGLGWGLLFMQKRDAPMYEVVLSAQAQKNYASADQALAKKLATCFEQLEQSPRYHPNIKSLKGDFVGYYSGSHSDAVRVDLTP